jgi:hypothetical protein
VRESGGGHHLAAPRAYLHHITLGDIPCCGVGRMNLYLGRRGDGLQARRAVRHGATVPVVEDTAGREDERVGLVRFLGRGLVRNWTEQSLAARELSRV